MAGEGVGTTEVTVPGWTAGPLVPRSTASLGPFGMAVPEPSGEALSDPSRAHVRSIMMYVLLREHPVVGLAAVQLRKQTDSRSTTGP